MKGDERGSVTPLVLGGMGTVLVLTVMLSVVGAVLVTVRRAQAAADLAALAAATAVQRGDDGCAAAQALARVNFSKLSACSVTGEVVRVEVERLTPRLFGREITVTAMAVAGPS